jgi:hypothetical protein
VSKLNATPEWLDARTSGKPIGVDRDNRVINGYTVAELGQFKDDRGQFNPDSLKKIIELYRDKPAGLKSRFTHPNMSSDGLATIVGRSKDAWLDGPRVRANLHLSDHAFGPEGNYYGDKILSMAEEDPDLFGSSLVLKVDRLEVLDDKKRPKTDDKGNPVPPIWMPTALLASDIVGDGAAVHGSFLSTDEELPDHAVRLASQALDQLFAGAEREVVESRGMAFLQRYLNARYGAKVPFDGDLLKRALELKAKGWQD